MNRFVVGSGRCGSTLLTNMLAQHPDVMVISEFMGGLERDRWFGDQPITAQQFLDFINHTHVPVDICVRRGFAPDELLSDTSDRKPVHLLMLSCLPILSDEPEKLLEEIQQALAKFPDQLYIDHLNQMYQWMMHRLDKSLWIERSGAAIEYLPDLVEAYPDAKYLHIHRDGRECALSMQQFPILQVIASFYYDPPTREEVEKTEYGGQAISEDDPFSKRFKKAGDTLELFGKYWSYQQTVGFSAMARLDKDQVKEVWFEDLLARPDETMRGIAEFFELPDSEGWINNACKLIKGVPSSRFRKLTEKEKRILNEACETGQLLLGREVSDWINPSLALIREVEKSQ